MLQQNKTSPQLSGLSGSWDDVNATLQDIEMLVPSFQGYHLGGASPEHFIWKDRQQSTTL
jgi:hypothetical protein